jgi:hypothetical protein
MDPITAIGFAANILQFIDYSAKVISAGIEIYESTSGSTWLGRDPFFFQTVSCFSLQIMSSVLLGYSLTRNI